MTAFYISSERPVGEVRLKLRRTTTVLERLVEEVTPDSTLVGVHEWGDRRVLILCRIGALCGKKCSGSFSNEGADRYGGLLTDGGVAWSRNVVV